MENKSPEKWEPIGKKKKKALKNGEGEIGGKIFHTYKIVLY